LFSMCRSPSFFLVVDEQVTTLKNQFDGDDAGNPDIA